jgi:hypothetical protein
MHTPSGLALSPRQHRLRLVVPLGHHDQLLQLHQSPHLAARQRRRVVERQRLVRYQHPDPDWCYGRHDSVNGNDSAEAGQGHGYAQHYRHVQSGQQDEGEDSRDRVVLGISSGTHPGVLRRPTHSILRLRHRRMYFRIPHQLAQRCIGFHVGTHHHLGRCRLRRYVLTFPSIPSHPTNTLTSPPGIPPVLLPPRIRPSRRRPQHD